MNIILVSSRRPTVKTITLGRSQIFAGCAAILAALFVMAALINYAMLRYAAQAHDSAALTSLFTDTSRDDSELTRAYAAGRLLIPWHPLIVGATCGAIPVATPPRLMAIGWVSSMKPIASISSMKPIAPPSLRAALRRALK